MHTTCPECGAQLPAGGSCRDNFHALLLLEWDIPGGPGEGIHFLAVASYVLQHPDSMNYTAEALAGLRRNIADHLQGRVTLEQVRARTRGAADGPVRVTRRSGDEVVRWPVRSWPITVVEVLAGGVEGYAERVTAWARGIIHTLDAAGAGT
jgi:hypothetical protein